MSVKNQIVSKFGLVILYFIDQKFETFSFMVKRRLKTDYYAKRTLCFYIRLFLIESEMVKMPEMVKLANKNFKLFFLLIIIKFLFSV